jgi:hypothetical protein
MLGENASFLIEVLRMLNLRLSLKRYLMTIKGVMAALEYSKL